MLRVAVKGVLARKLRLILTSIAVVIGVAFVSGAFLLTDSMRASFDSLFTEAAAGLDVQVQTKEYKRLIKAQSTQGPNAVPIDLGEVGVPPVAIERVERVPGVDHAVGSIFEWAAQPLDKKGRPLGGNGAPAFAANWSKDAEDIGALRIARGRAPERGEVLLDATTMESGEYEVGDRVRVLLQFGRKVEEFEISGVAKFGSANNLNGASITVFETKQLQELLDMDGRFTAISVSGGTGVKQELLKARVARELGDDYDVITGSEFTDEQTAAIDEGFLRYLEWILLGFAAIAVFVGAFTIFNTFTILVGQRTREFGLLRVVGASRRQVLGIVVLEALLVGIVASTLGLIGGFGVAIGLRELIDAFSPGAFPAGEFNLQARTVMWSYVVGVLVTLVASLLPAWRAANLSPLEALRANPAVTGRGWKVPVVGAVLTVLGAAAVLAGLAGAGSVRTTLVAILGGFALALIGIALASRAFIGPVARILAVVFGRGTAGELATRNVLRNRARSATTAAALMIGLALASFVLVFQASVTKTIERQIDRILVADLIVFNETALSSGVGTIDPDIIEQMRDVEGVEQLAAQRLGAATVGAEFRPAGEDAQTLVAFDPGALDEDEGVIVFDVAAGASEPGDGVLVQEDLANERDVDVSDGLEIAFPDGESRTLEVRGTYEENDVVGGRLIVSAETFDDVQPAQQRAAQAVYVRTDDPQGAAAVGARIRRELGDDADFLQVLDSDELRDTFTAQFAPILGIILAMLGLSLIVALFGIANTLALNVFERTREIGLIRAVGGTRRQVRRIIRVEAVLLSLFGALVGVVVGLVAGAAMIDALDSEGFVLGVSWMPMAAVLVAGILLGLLAAIVPARRAARIDILEAIATE